MNERIMDIIFDDWARTVARSPQNWYFIGMGQGQRTTPLLEKDEDGMLGLYFWPPE